MVNFKFQNVDGTLLSSFKMLYFFQVQVLFQVSALFRRILSERLGALFQVESAHLFKYICMHRYMYIHT